MKIAALDVFVLEFAVRAMFVLAGGVAATPGVRSPRVLVKLTTDEGVSGWGACSMPCTSWKST